MVGVAPIRFTVWHWKAQCSGGCISFAVGSLRWLVGVVAGWASQFDVGGIVWWQVRRICVTLSWQGGEHGSGVPDLRPEFGIGVWGGGRLRLLA